MRSKRRRFDLYLVGSMVAGFAAGLLLGLTAVGSVTSVNDEPVPPGGQIGPYYPIPGMVDLTAEEAARFPKNCVPPEDWHADAYPARMVVRKDVAGPDVPPEPRIVPWDVDTATKAWVHLVCPGRS